MSVLPRHAVVIVHGIGEQRPLETLRGFVGSTPDQGVVPTDQPRFSSPDNLLGTFYERRIKVCWDQTGAAADLPPDPPPYQWRMANTDFYELYWAYRFRDSRLGHIAAWALPRLRRSRRTLFTERLLGPDSVWMRFAVVLLAVLSVLAWFAADTFVLRRWVSTLSPPWAAVVSIAAGAVALVAGFWLAGRCGLLSFIRFGFLLVLSIFTGVLLALVRGDVTLVEVMAAIASSAAVSAVVGAIVGGLVKSLGDAARYLDSSADNLTESEAIKTQAVALLEALHDAVDDETGRPAYDRVVVVGHSLGTVVAYDAIRNLWARWHQRLPFSEDVATAGAVLIQAVEQAGTAVTADGQQGTREAYRAAQQALSHYLRNPVPDGHTPDGTAPRWIISDFVTLACPLAHADLLVASDRSDLHRLTEERLLATSPPDRQRIATARRRPYRFRKPARGAVPALTYLHHAAPFAAVRWTNFYFAHDVVGGPLAPVLGPGIEDHELGRLRSFADMALHYPHSSYWTDASHFNSAGVAQTRTFLTDLVRRRPTLLLSLAAETPPSVLAALREHLESLPAGPFTVDVQLFVEGPGERQPAWFPVRSAAVPDRQQLALLRRTVRDYGRITLLLSPDVLHRTGPMDDGDQVDQPAEPGTEDELPEQAEAEDEEVALEEPEADTPRGRGR